MASYNSGRIKINEKKNMGSDICLDKLKKKRVEKCVKVKKKILLMLVKIKINTKTGRYQKRMSQVSKS